MPNKISYAQWERAINGCASVLGSILLTILAVFFGFSAVFLFVGAAYLLSLGIVVLHTRGKA